MRRRILVGVVVFVGIAAVLMACALVPLRQADEQICTLTGSRRVESTQLFGGNATVEYTHQSALDRYLASKHPEMLRHRWFTIAITQTMVLGGTLTRHDSGHSVRKIADLDAYVESLDGAERVALYKTLLADDIAYTDAIKADIARWLKATSDK